MTMPLLPVPKLGVGLSYQPGLRDAIRDADALLGFLEISPDILCREQIVQGRRMLAFQPALLDEALRWSEAYPTVVHGLGLSIGSACEWNQDYLRILDQFSQHCPMAWHSEHLGYLQITAPNGDMLHSGVQLPMPFTEEALELLVPRIKALIERFERPFLIENTTHYLTGLPASAGLDEIAFLNELSWRSGCGLLFDVHNFYCNAVNFGFDAKEALAKLDMQRVQEIHVAGGASSQGYVMDVHSDVVPEQVWSLLEWMVPQTINLGGIVYELLEQALHVVGHDGIKAQLERANEVWSSVPRCAAVSHLDEVVCDVAI